MSVNESRVRVQHMLDAAHEVISFTSGHTRDDLEDDMMLVRALSMSTGIIGEAASHISEDFKSSHPSIPWKQIVGMRNFLFHEYFRVDPDILWQTATHAIPDLVPQLEQIVSESDSSTEA